MSRRHRDQESSDAPLGNSLQMVRNQVNVPVGEEATARFGNGPCQRNEVPEAATRSLRWNTLQHFRQRGISAHDFFPLSIAAWRSFSAASNSSSVSRLRSTLVSSGSNEDC